MKRRVFCGAVGALLATPAALGQPAAMRRIAILEHGEKGLRDAQWAILEARLRELGYVEGKSLFIDRRWANSDNERLPRLAQELLAGKPEVVLVNTTPATQALMRLTGTVPIVFTSVADPVAAGIVASLARPGGNVTGFSAQLTDVNEKRFDLLREILPQAKRFGLLGPASNLGVQAVLKRLQAAARSIGADVSLRDAGDAATIGRVFENLRAEPLDALLVASVLAPHNRQIVDLAEKSRIPASFIQNPMLEAGALVVFGPQSDVQYRSAADYVHRILAGAKPADLPVVQPREFWLGVNLRTARALGLTIPQAVLLRADKVIE
jgi:putative tryptophan/tyrosine transport system substrate-binding protein